MIQHYRKIQRQRAAGEIDGAGFTLIELLIVIVVLGILAATVIFALGGVTGQSAQAACNSDAKSIEIAVEAYQASPDNATNSWPAAATNVAALVTAPFTNAQSGNADTFLRALPSNSAYGISLGANGVVLVTPKGGTAVNYDNESGTSLASGGCGAVS